MISGEDIASDIMEYSAKDVNRFYFMEVWLIGVVSGCGQYGHVSLGI